jgi:hypothetical protein
MADDELYEVVQHLFDWIMHGMSPSNEKFNSIVFHAAIHYMQELNLDITLKGRELRRIIKTSLQSFYTSSDPHVRALASRYSQLMFLRD